MKGRCLNRLTTEPRIIRHSIFSYRKTPRVGLEPTTPRLTAACSTIELSRNIPAAWATAPPSHTLRHTPHWAPRPYPQNRTPPHTQDTPYPHHTKPPRWVSPRPISTRQLHASLHFHTVPTYLVVCKGPYRLRVGGPILRGASHLDAFSAYPSRAWLPCRGPGGPAGAPAARPPRSSRTGGSPSQASCACAG